MIERLEIIKAKYDELQAELMKPETLSNVNKTTELSREIANLEETVTCYNRYLEVEQQIKEAKELAKKGTSEIVLIAQDTTSYGKDIYGKPSLKELLIELNKIEELSWIRVMYTYPSLLNDELLQTMNELDKVVKYIDEMPRTEIGKIDGKILDNLVTEE